MKNATSPNYVYEAQNSCGHWKFSNFSSEVNARASHFPLIRNWGTFSELNFRASCFDERRKFLVMQKFLGVIVTLWWRAQMNLSNNVSHSFSSCLQFLLSTREMLAWGICFTHPCDEIWFLGSCDSTTHRSANYNPGSDNYYILEFDATWCLTIS